MIASRSLSIAGPAAAPVSAFTLKPLSVHGLWLAVITIPAFAFRRIVAHENDCVGAAAVAGWTSASCAATTSAAAAAKCSEAKRRSKPMTTPRSAPPFLTTHSATDCAQTRTASKVYSSAIRARQPSVPKTIFKLVLPAGWKPNASGRAYRGASPRARRGATTRFFGGNAWHPARSGDLRCGIDVGGTQRRILVNWHAFGRAVHVGARREHEARMRVVLEGGQHGRRAKHVDPHGRDWIGRRDRRNGDPGQVDHRVRL